jgi:hypothetical protein
MYMLLGGLNERYLIDDLISISIIQPVNLQKKHLPDIKKCELTKWLK